MTEAWVRSVIAPHVVNDFLVLTRWPDGGIEQSIPVVDFVAMFVGVSQPTYANMVAADGGKLGYKPIFDGWKAEKLL